MIRFCEEFGASLSRRYGLDEREDVFLAMRAGQSPDCQPQENAT